MMSVYESDNITTAHVFVPMLTFEGMPTILTIDDDIKKTLSTPSQQNLIYLGNRLIEYGKELFNLPEMQDICKTFGMTKERIRYIADTFIYDAYIQNPLLYFQGSQIIQEILNEIMTDDAIESKYSQTILGLRIIILVEVLQLMKEDRLKYLSRNVFYYVEDGTDHFYLLRDGDEQHIAFYEKELSIIKTKNPRLINSTVHANDDGYYYYIKASPLEDNGILTKNTIYVDITKDEAYSLHTYFIV